ncbi:MAG: alanine racemase [Chthoniobacterales bacterium]
MSRTNTRRCWVEIDLEAVRHNAVVAKMRAGEGVALLAIVKANAYGHGLAAVAQALADHAQLFGVANLTEALALRAFVPHPVMIMGPALPAERAGIVQAGFIASVSSFAEALEFSGACRSSPALLNCAIDSGMGRMGVSEAEAGVEITRIAALPNVRLHSISTHLPSPDDATYTHAQLERFGKLVRQLRSAVSSPVPVHSLPSAGVISFPEAAHEMVRAGLMLYGISPVADFQKALRPALTWKTRVILLRTLEAGRTISYGRTFTANRPMRVATLSVGYADGLPRAVSNRGAAVLIGGRRCAILGRVTMDLIVVDVSHVPGIALGDEAVLIGRQGEEEILATEMAERASTIAWEIFTGIGTRVARVYL